MALAFGSLLASRVYLGATEINLAYFGANQVYSSGPSFSAEAKNYFNRLDAAGDTTYVDYKLPLANYIDGLVTLGGAYWNDMVSACSFVGVGIQGITVPLRAGMASAINVNNNFVAADLDQLTGLKGDGSTKYISTGVLDTATAQNDYSMSSWVTDPVYVDNAYWMGSPRIAHRASTVDFVVKFSTNNNSSSQISVSPDTANNFIGQVRTVGTEYDYLINTTSGTALKDSIAPTGSGISVFAWSAGNAKNASRIATYHYGPALDLATLEALQATLLLEVKISNAVASYFSRLDTAGDTTYVDYKQPLTNYISSLVTLGGAYWDTMESAASFVGVGIQGITVPLREGMAIATQSNFVAGDLNQLTGLKANGTLGNKYINTGVSSSNLALNDASASVFVTELDTTRAGYFGAASTGGSMRMFGSATRQYGSDREQIHGNNVSALQVVSVNSLNGMSRDNASNFNFYNGADNTVADVSTIAAGGDINLFVNNASTRYSNPRIATYHVGPALDLATLDALQEQLLAELQYAAFSAQAASYFYRLDAAGDTTYTPYKQPLANYIDGLVTNGLWNGLLSAACFVGVGIQGMLVPLKSGMSSITNVNNNFVSGDLNQLTGLKGDGSTKYLGTGITKNDLLQNDLSMSVYLTQVGTLSNVQTFIGAQTTALIQLNASSNTPRIANSGGSFTDSDRGAGFYGASRDNSAGFDIRFKGTDYASTETSIAISGTDQLSVFARSGSNLFSNWGIGTYHIGTSVGAAGLITLEALQATLITEIAAI